MVINEENGRVSEELTQKQMRRALCMWWNRWEVTKESKTQAVNSALVPAFLLVGSRHARPFFCTISTWLFLKFFF